MAEARWERLAALTGILFVPLYIGATILLGGALGDTAGETVESMTARLADNDVQVVVGAILAGLGSAALVWFSGSLRSALRVAEGGSGRLSALVLAAGTVAATALLIAALLGAGAAFFLDEFEDATAAVPIYASAGAVGFFGVPFGLGLMLAASGVVSVRTGALPSWLAWAGSVVGPILVVGFLFFPVTAIGGILAGVWVLIVSGVLASRAGDRPAAS